MDWRRMSALSNQIPTFESGAAYEHQHCSLTFNFSARSFPSPLFAAEARGEHSDRDVSSDDGVERGLIRLQTQYTICDEACVRAFR